MKALARDLLAGEGTRLPHVRTAGLVATRLSVLFDPEDAELLVAAATLHDIGQSARIAHTGFHPLDGGAFLRAQGYPERLARLVAHHSLAMMTAPAQVIDDLSQRFPREDGLLADALAYADLQSAPDGRLIPTERRLADIARRHPDRAEADRAQQLRPPWPGSCGRWRRRPSPGRATGPDQRPPSPPPRPVKALEARGPERNIGLPEHRPCRRSAPTIPSPSPRPSS